MASCRCVKIKGAALTLMVSVLSGGCMSIKLISLSAVSEIRFPDRYKMLGMS
jgi:hypothetical protein